MSEVRIGTQNGQWMAIHRDRDLFTEALPTESFRLFSFHNLSDQAWQSVAVLTTQGVVLFEMQDDNWIRGMFSYPPDAREGIISLGRSFGPGTVPNTFIGEIGDHLDQSVNDILEEHEDRVTIYLINGWNDVCFRGSNGMFFNIQGESIPDSEVSNLSTRIMVNTMWFYYLIHLDSGQIAIAVFDRFGDLQMTSFIRGNAGHTLTEGNRILIPLSLQVRNGRIEMEPMIENPVVVRILNEGIGLVWGDYMSTYPDYYLYFVDHHLEAYLGSNEGYIRVSDHESLLSDDIPEGVVRYIPFGSNPDSEVILYIEDGLATVYSILGDRVIENSHVFLDLPSELQHQTRLWKLLGPDNGPLMNLFSYPGFDPSTYRDYLLLNGRFFRIGPSEPTGLTSMFAPGSIPARSPSPELFPPQEIQPLQRARPIPSPPRAEAGAPLFREAPPSRSEQPTIRQIDIFNRRSLERFLSWYYPSPLAAIIEPDLLEDYTRTSLNEISQLLASGQVTRFETPPVMQPWAGPPGTPNRIFTFQIVDGRKLFVKAQYNQQTNQLLPPV